MHSITERKEQDSPCRFAVPLSSSSTRSVIALRGREKEENVCVCVGGWVCERTCEIKPPSSLSLSLCVWYCQRGDERQGSLLGPRFEGEEREKEKKWGKQRAFFL